MAGGEGSSWTRALMASSGVALAHDAGPRHASPEWLEASAPETPLSRLQKLASCKEIAVREVIARRLDCPMGLLATLAHDARSEVRAGVAGNPRITQAVAERLVDDKDPRVLKALSRNHDIALDLLQRLVTHKKDEVRRVAARQLDERLAKGQSAEAPAGDLPFELRDRVTPPTQWGASQALRSASQGSGARPMPGRPAPYGA